MNRVKTLFTKIRELTRKPVMNVLPGQLAFFFVLSIPPLIALIVIIGKMFSISTEGLISFVNESFPASTSNLIVPIINSNGFNLSFLFFVIGAFVMVTKGTNAIITTSNVLYNIEDVNNMKKQVKSIFLVIMLILLFAFIIIVPAFGDLIMSLLNNLDYLNPIYDELMIVYNIIKIPASFVFIYFIIKIIYTIAPDKSVKSRDVTYGALFTTTFWIVATQAYSYYVTNFAAYDVFYGSIAGLIILLLWIYLLSYIFVLGMALNALTNSIELNKKKKT